MQNQSIQAKITEAIEGGRLVPKFLAKRRLTRSTAKRVPAKLVARPLAFINVLSLFPKAVVGLAPTA